MKSTSGNWNFKYTTRDIVIIAVIAAIAGVVNTGVGNIWYLANSSLGPLGGAHLLGHRTHADVGGRATPAASGAPAGGISNDPTPMTNPLLPLVHGSFSAPLI